MATKHDPQAILIALGKAKGGQGDPDAAPDTDSDSDSDDNAEGQKAVAADILNAIKTGDPGALASALRDFLDTCDTGPAP